jgi:O-antigen/teichoic acid export membrane protein
MSDKLFVLATAYRIVFGIAGCYLAARLAPDRPMKHALILGVVGLVLSIAGAAAMWGAGPGWYSLAIIAITLPCAWIGGKVVLIQRRADD